MTNSKKVRPVCSHCGQVFDKEPPKEGPRGVLAAVTSQLLRWADESVHGGWTTHQVLPMRALAGRLSSFLVTGRMPADEAKEGV